MADRILIRNAHLASHPDGAADASLVLDEGKIERVSNSSISGSFEQEIDAAGRMVAPGFIDVHIHGAGGRDALDGNREAMEIISRTLARMGTTGFLATTFAARETHQGHLRGLADLTGKDLGGAHLLGIHMEGPFINLTRKGGILPEVIYPASREAIDEILEATAGALRLMTIAPELPGNLDVIRTLADHGVVPSIGHSDASYEEALRGFDAGVKHVTHLYNALPGLHHRAPGPLLAIFEKEDITAELIADGVHVGSDIIRWTAAQLGPERAICVTDGIHGTGLPEGRYEFNGRDYESRGGTARYLDGSLIGTTLGLGEILRRFVRWSGMPVADAIKTVTANPARILGLGDRKGAVEAGYDADLVLLDEELDVSMTIVGGEIVFDAATSTAGGLHE